MGHFSNCPSLLSVSISTLAGEGADLSAFFFFVLDKTLRLELCLTSLSNSSELVQSFCHSEEVSLLLSIIYIHYYKTSY